MRTRQWLKAIRYVNYRVAVVGEMAISFSANRVQQASYLMLHLHKSRGEFEIRAIRYINYRYAEVGESAIRFLSNLAQKSHRFLSRVHVIHVFFIPKMPRKAGSDQAPTSLLTTLKSPISPLLFSLFLYFLVC